MHRRIINRFISFIYRQTSLDIIPVRFYVAILIVLINKLLVRCNFRALPLCFWTKDLKEV